MWLLTGHAFAAQFHFRDAALVRIRHLQKAGFGNPALL